MKGPRARYARYKESSIATAVLGPETEAGEETLVYEGYQKIPFWMGCAIIGRRERPTEALGGDLAPWG